MRKMCILLCALMLIPVYSLAYGAEKVLYSFENNIQGWEIPDWAREKDDHVVGSLNISNKYAKDGSYSLEVNTNFPGGIWSAAYLEIVEYFDWTPYSAVSIDVYIPSTTPAGLKAKIILTQGEDWAWWEMSRSIALEPGVWTTIKADLKAASMDWKRVTPDDSFRQDIRKFGVRVESNLRPIYKGPVYIDNIKLVE